MWTFYFKTACHMYNTLEMDEDRKTPEQKFSDVEFEIFVTDYHTWGCPIFVLESPLQGGPLPKWEPRAITRVL